MTTTADPTRRFTTDMPAGLAEPVRRFEVGNHYAWRSLRCAGWNIPEAAATLLLDYVTRSVLAVPAAYRDDLSERTISRRRSSAKTCP